ncbi:ciliary neurotrophic factor isoform X2 [Neopsephotus bourkii]|uniref:ciliary neurotrophic factor isoform X2 n=1 Tax=Neopsephotus bourkii TaxID=309878 RepID=UPI002AA54B6F|nr:ciliary neurotrophic factor isoform X2 [Neopsephotus bourkii]
MSVVPGPRRGRGGEPGQQTCEWSSRLECTSSAGDCPPRAGQAPCPEPGAPAARAMAAADSASATLRRRDLCSRGIRLAGKMRSDVVDLLDTYVEQQGLDASASVAAVEGVPVAAVERWDEQTGTQRLLENLAAYRAFRALLAQMLDEQQEQLGEADATLGPALAAVLLQVSAFTYHLEELLRLENRGPPGEEAAVLPIPPQLSLFERKLRGLGVLRELAQWAVRSVRDLRQLAKPGPGSCAGPSPAESP